MRNLYRNDTHRMCPAERCKDVLLEPGHSFALTVLNWLQAPSSLQQLSLLGNSFSSNVFRTSKEKLVRSAWSLSKYIIQVTWPKYYTYFWPNQFQITSLHSIKIKLWTKVKCYTKSVYTLNQSVYSLQQSVYSLNLNCTQFSFKLYIIIYTLMIKCI